MSEQRMSMDHAKTIATGYGAHMVNEVRAARTIVAVGDVLDTLEGEVQQTSYRPRYDEGMAHVIRVIRETLDPSSAN